MNNALADGHPDRTPDAVMRHLLDGNHRFVTGNLRTGGRDRSRREMLIAGQTPIVTVLGCSDSRVAPEVLFDQGLGDVFSVRTAGHIIDAAVLGTIEYGVKVLGTPVVMVLGHESCGALTAARARIKGEPLPGGFSNEIVFSVLAPFVPSEAPSEEFAMMRAHVDNTVVELLNRSPVLRDAVDSGATCVVGMKYGLATGEVRYVGHAGQLDTAGFPVATH